MSPDSRPLWYASRVRSVDVNESIVHSFPLGTRVRLEFLSFLVKEQQNRNP